MNIVTLPSKDLRVHKNSLNQEPGLQKTRIKCMKDELKKMKLT